MVFLVERLLFDLNLWLKLSIEQSCIKPRTFHKHKCITVSFYVFVLKQDDKGKFNFDQTAVRNPETEELVSFFVYHFITFISGFHCALCCL